MRALFSLVALLVALYIVFQLAGTQLAALRPTRSASEPGQGGVQPAARNAAQDAAARVQQAIEAGAAARASAPEGTGR